MGSNEGPEAMDVRVNQPEAAASAPVAGSARPPSAPCRTGGATGRWKGSPLCRGLCGNPRLFDHQVLAGIVDDSGRPRPQGRRSLELITRHSRPARNSFSNTRSYR